MSLSFLSHSAANSPTCSKRPGENAKYTPLLGVWLIDIALYFGWHRPSHPKRWPEMFEDSDFCAMTGLDTDNEVEPERMTAGHCMKLLVRQRQKLTKKKLADSLPLFRNIKLLSEMLQLTEADQAVFTFAAGLSIFTEFRSAIGPRSQKTTTDSLCKLLAHLTGIKDGEFHRALQPDSPLVSTGLIKLSKRLCDLEEKVELLSGMQDVMLKPNKSADSLMLPIPAKPTKRTDVKATAVPL